MIIGEASERTGLPPKTIRYYEEIGLVAARRAANGYRDYDGVTLQRLGFIARARSLGFSLDECRMLLSLWDDQHRASADVKTLAERKIAEIDRKMAELAELRGTLSDLARGCAGDARPDCPIISSFAGRSAGHPPKSPRG